MKKFEGYLIVSDLDGTFLGKKSRIVEENVRAIEYFKENGGLFTFATGRAFYNARIPLPNMEDFVNTVVITSNGTAFYDANTGELSRLSFMDREKAIEAVRYAHEKYPDLHLRMTGTDGFYIYEDTTLEKNLFAKIPPQYVHFMPYEEWPHDVWLKLVYLGVPERIQEFKEDITYKFPEFEFALSSPRLYEFQVKGVNKGTAIKTLKADLEAEYGYPITVYAAGDYGNDTDMLKCADVAVCPENALPEIKEICDYTFCHHDEGLIADIVKHIEENL